MKTPPKIKSKPIKIYEGSVYEEYCDTVNKAVCEIAVYKGTVDEKQKFDDRRVFEGENFAVSFTNTESGNKQYMVYLRAKDDWYSVYLYQAECDRDILYLHIPSEWTEALFEYARLIKMTPKVDNRKKIYKVKVQKIQRKYCLRNKNKTPLKQEQ